MNLNFDQLYEVDWSTVLLVLLPIIVINLILIFAAFIDLYIHRDNRPNKLIWIMVILLFNTIGPVLYFVIGRKRG